MFKLIKIVTYLFLLSGLEQTTVFAAAEASGTLYQQLGNIRSMTAFFQQKVTAEGREVSTSKGIMAIEKPGRFRWQTVVPNKQLLIADGKQIWIYDEELEQVTVKKQDKNLNETASLFIDEPRAVDKNFKVSLTESASQRLYDLQAKSKQANFQRLRLLFEKNILKSIEIDDQLGQHTTIRFTDMKLNSSIAPHLFEFNPPQGVDVIKQ